LKNEIIDLAKNRNTSINKDASLAHNGQGNWPSSSSPYLFLRRRSVNYLGFCKSSQRSRLVWVV